jgi:hypothetical protein
MDRLKAMDLELPEGRTLEVLVAGSSGMPLVFYYGTPCGAVPFTKSGLCSLLLRNGVLHRTEQGRIPVLAAIRCRAMADKIFLPRHARTGARFGPIASLAGSFLTALS